jgi:hypothetical protein
MRLVDIRSTMNVYGNVVAEELAQWRTRTWVPASGFEHHWDRSDVV